MAKKSWQEIQYICEECKGTSKFLVYPPGLPAVETTIPCSNCNGTGYKIWGRLGTEKVEEP